MITFLLGFAIVSGASTVSFIEGRSVARLDQDTTAANHKRISFGCDVGSLEVFGKMKPQFVRGDVVDV